MAIHAQGKTVGHRHDFQEAVMVVQIDQFPDIGQRRVFRNTVRASLFLPALDPGGADGKGKYSVGGDSDMGEIAFSHFGDVLDFYLELIGDIFPGQFVIGYFLG